MEHQLASLEAKISQVVDLCQRLLAENDALRSQLRAATGERDRLAGTIDAARTRLEALADKLPDA